MTTQPMTHEPRCACGELLKLSVYRQGPDGEEKSCPECSRRAGRHIYHPLQQFGEREMEQTTKIQSWCKTCRALADKDKAT